MKNEILLQKECHIILPSLTSSISKNGLTIQFIPPALIIFQLPTLSSCTSFCKRSLVLLAQEVNFCHLYGITYKFLSPETTKNERIVTRLDFLYKAQSLLFLNVFYSSKNELPIQFIASALVIFQPFLVSRVILQTLASHLKLLAQEVNGWKNEVLMKAVAHLCSFVEWLNVFSFPNPP